MTSRRILPLCALALLLSAACSDDNTPAADAGLDGAADGGSADAAPPPLAPEREPSAVAVAQWMVGWIPTSMSSDPVLAQLEQGSFTYPKTGYDANKVHWSTRKPEKNGALGKFPAGISYAATRLTVGAKQTTQLFIRSGPTAGVWVNGVRCPGDIYASRKVWVPLPVKQGENLVVVRIVGGRSAVQAELWSTEDELVFNTKDATLPQLVVGQKAEQCLGLPVLNLTGAAAYDLVARVKGDALFEETSVSYPSLAPRAVTQVAFSLKPKQAIAAAKQELELTLLLESRSLNFAYQRKIKISTVAADVAYSRTRLSAVDRSCQYSGVLPPANFDKSKKYGLVLSLHGAGVQALGQAKSYSQKDWAYVVAPTNRRPFGFDWEVWGRLDALEALAAAKKAFNIDPTRVYVTGHSMGGHGTWHVSVMHPGRFAVAAPSAGWSSFYSYVPSQNKRPTGVFARTQAHSDTNVYLSNLARRAVYILHGGADTNVPVREGQEMFKQVSKYTKDVTYHEEPGKGHWWNGSKAKGVDCVDWPDIFKLMKSRTLDPFELTFDFKTPAPWVSADHSYVSLRSQQDPYKDSTLSSSKSDAKTVALTTTNVRSMVLDGDALKQAGVATVVVDGKSITVTSGAIKVGPQQGKAPGVHGPFNEVMYRPFCLVYPDQDPAEYARYAAYLVSSWAVIGNGSACAMPLSRLKAGAPAGYNLIFLGVDPKQIPGATLPFSWDSATLKVGGSSYSSAALTFVFPLDKRLAGVMTATKGSEYLLYRIQPFTSRLVLPDYLVLAKTGARAAGFFDADWKYDAKLGK